MKHCKSRITAVVGAAIFTGSLSINMANAQSLWEANSPFLKGIQTVPHMEPTLPHETWEAEAATKLEDLEKKTGRKPNILIFIIDDMGWGDPGCYGGGAAVGAPTPNMDALARSGLLMTSCYSQPSCTPSRAAFQTGRLPQRTGQTRPTAAGEKAQKTQELYLAKVLSEAGYATGMAGKWHLGESVGSRPTDQGGYDEFYGNLGVNTVYHDWRDGEISPEVVYNPEKYRIMAEEVEFIRHSVKLTKGSDEMTLVDEINLENEPLLEEQYLEWSKDFIRRSVKAEKPFYLHHAMNRVHTKNYPHPDFRGKSPAGTPYKDGILEVDWVLGEIIKELKDTGQLENTLVFLSSDNGAEEDVMAGGIFTSDAGHSPWRGAKGTTWEGGVRVSGIASWPGMIKSGRSSDGLFDQMDLFTTSIRIAGGNLDTLPKDRYYDAIDQTGWLLTEADDKQESNREAIYYWYGQDFYGVRWQYMKRMERIMTIGTNPGPGTFGGLFNATTAETTDPTLGWYYNLYMDPKERIPTTRTWAIAPLVELSIRSKLSFLKYPQAPRGVKIGGYILGGPGGGTVPKGVLEAMRENAISPAAMPD
ncbi:MAG: arylsulfatase [Verrucomicrobia bacterium]|nr:MAG: arylsulfatase [Verrucomicrobiota bacterium]